MSASKTDTKSSVLLWDVAISEVDYFTDLSAAAMTVTSSEGYILFGDYSSSHAHGWHMNLHLMACKSVQIR